MHKAREPLDLVLLSFRYQTREFVGLLALRVKFLNWDVEETDRLELSIEVNVHHWLVTLDWRSHNRRPWLFREGCIIAALDMFDCPDHEAAHAPRGNGGLLA